MLRYTVKFVSFIFSLCTIFFSPHAYAQVDSVSRRIILVGDAGQLTGGTHPELNLLKKVYNLDDKKNTVVFLGDNIYPLGLPSIYSSSYQAKKNILDDQVNVVKGTQAQAYFIPGNHDWMRGRPGGWQQIINQGTYINSLGMENVHFLPQGGCPGPEEISLSNKIVLVIIDSQWWLQQYDKPGIRSGCDVRSESELLAAIQDVVDRNRNKMMIFASHHPFITYGRHGGYYGLKQHIFPFTEIRPNLYIPLPVLGSIYPIVRGVFGDIQDLKHPIYKNYSSSIDSILKQHPYCIRVAGHEHNLQLIQLQNQFYIVSGAGSKQSETNQGAGTLFSDNGPGFTVIETLINGNVKVSLFSHGKDTTGKPIYSQYLPPLDTTVAKTKAYVVNPFPDSVVFKGYPKYEAGKFHRWLLGNNYREEWTKSIKVKVFDIGKEHGGLTPTKRGGGMQTKSLRLEDAKGNEYVLRTIEKFPDNTLPEEFRKTIVKDAVVDGISASYPYAALSIPPLADAAGVQAAYPRLVYVPDDPRFGYYQPEFANTLCIYEEREPGNYYDKSYSTEKVLEKTREDNDDKVDQQYVLRARLFDMFIMDFDRHEDQWRWGTRDTGKGKIYFPIPRDRDQAFFVNNGVIPAFVRKSYIFPKFQGFRAKAININTFNFNARYFDRSFLYGLNENDWKKRADTLIEQMIDGVIDYALTLQPKEIQKYHADRIVETLKKRRQYFPAEALQYYRFLAKNVDVPGSNKRELFLVNRENNGDVKLQVYKITKEGNKSSLLTDRTFKYKETKEIRLYGFGGEDHFLINGSGRKKTIRLRLIGGDSTDVFENNSKAGPGKTIVYDRLGDTSKLIGTGVFRNRISDDPQVNELDRRAFKYNLIIPGVSLSYNLDDGLYLGARVKQIRHGFRKEPYKLKQELAINHALATNSFNFKYNFEFIDFAGDGDLVVNASLRAPRATSNYFGLGNTTLFDKSGGKNIDYYRTRYDKGDLALLIRNQAAEYMSVAFGPAFSYAFIDRNENLGRIISHPSAAGLDSASLYRHKAYGGGLLSINIDNRNDPVLPSRGVLWKTDVKLNYGFGKYTTNSTQINTDLSLFISANNPTKLVIAARIGAGWSLGQYEFFQAQYLGGIENLRGFRRERFAGSRMLFNNLELRYQIKEVETYLFPGAIGLLAFNDVGRVWVKGEHSKGWHNGYGGGVWVAPAKRAVLTFSYSRSREGALPLVTFGYQF